VHEIETTMPCTELDEWLEWFVMKAEVERKAQQEARRNNRRR
jgi:hypothetical protein